MLRLGLIGTRFARAVHLPAFRSLAGVEVVAVAGASPERTLAMADAEGLVAFHDWRELIASRRVGAVAIAVPPAVQPAVVVAAARAGIHVFCEKPMASSLAEAEGMLEEVERAGIVHAINFGFPESHAWVGAKQVVDSGALGPLRRISYRWHVETRAARVDDGSWKAQPQVGGGALGNFGPHVFHNLEWLCGPIQDLACCAPPSALAVDAAVELVSGVPARVSIWADAFRGQGHVIEVFGQDGTLVLANPGADYISGFDVRLATRVVPAWQTVVPAPPVTDDDGRIAVTARIAERFRDAIERGGHVTPGLREGLRAQRVVAAAGATHVGVRGAR